MTTPIEIALLGTACGAWRPMIPATSRDPHMRATTIDGVPAFTVGLAPGVERVFCLSKECTLPPFTHLGRHPEPCTAGSNMWWVLAAELPHTWATWAYELIDRVTLPAGEYVPWRKREAWCVDHDVVNELRAHAHSPEGGPYQVIVRVFREQPDPPVWPAPWDGMQPSHGIVDLQEKIARSLFTEEVAKTGTDD